MPTKNIQDVVAEKIERIIEHFNNQFTDQDDGTFSVGLDTRYATKEDFVEFIRVNLTQLVKDERERIGEDLMRLAEGERIDIKEGLILRTRAGASRSAIRKWAKKAQGKNEAIDTIKQHITQLTGATHEK